MLTEDEKQSMRQNLHVMQSTMKLTLASFDLKPDKPLGELLASYHDLENQFNTKPQTNLRTMFSAAPGVSIEELIQLMQDLSGGKINAYLQEALTNAELKLKIVAKDQDDPNSRKVLSINIQVAATAIDKYANLLEIILGQNNLPQNQHELIQNAYDNFFDSNKRLEQLQRDRFILGLKYLPLKVDDYINFHESMTYCCGLFKKQPSKQYHALMDWFNKLPEESLSAYELAGAIYFIRNQIQNIPILGERDAFRDTLDWLLKENDYPEYTKKDRMQLIQPYIQLYSERAKTQGINPPFSFEDDKQEIKAAPL